MKEVKIVWFSNYTGREEYRIADTERKLAKLLNEGWQIVTAGSGENRASFVILVRDTG